MIRRVGILTGGGDAPGLNAVIRAVTLTARQCYGWEVVGIRNGLYGLLKPLPLVDLSAQPMADLLARGGTMIGAASGGDPLNVSVSDDNGQMRQVDLSPVVIERIAEYDLDAVVVAGGDGTMGLAWQLVQQGARMVGVPKTIDNDLSGTDSTFGFDTAVATATDALNRLRTTAASHNRVMVLEVMGRHAGWIALRSGIAGGADAILLPEIPFSIDVVAQRLQAVLDAGQPYALVVVAEGAVPVGGEPLYIMGKGSARFLGGVGNIVAEMIGERLPVEVRALVLGHLQRGGDPTSYDRWLATRMGAAAPHLVAREAWGQMVALQGDTITSVPMADAMRMKLVDPLGEEVQTARNLGVVFG